MISGDGLPSCDETPIVGVGPHSGHAILGDPWIGGEKAEITQIQMKGSILSVDLMTFPEDPYTV